MTNPFTAVQFSTGIYLGLDFLGKKQKGKDKKEREEKKVESRVRLPVRSFAFSISKGFK